MAKKTSKAYDRALKEYRQLAKRADQRLVRLEKLSQEENFKGVTGYAYARAMRDIKTWSGENARRFNTSPPETVQALKAKIADIENFLESKTSKKKDIIEFYEKRAETINDRYGADLNWKDLANYFKRGIASKFNRLYGSKTAMRAIGVIQENTNKIQSDIKRKRHIDLEVEDEVLNDAITNMLQYHRKDLKRVGIL